MDFLLNQSGTPTHSKWASSLTVSFKVADVLPAMYLKGTQYVLLFGSDVAKNKGDVVNTGDRVSGVPTLAGGMQQRRRSSSKGGLQFSGLEHFTFSTVAPTLQSNPTRGPQPLR